MYSTLWMSDIVVGTTKEDHLVKSKEAPSIKLDRQQWNGIYQASVGVRIP